MDKHLAMPLNISRSQAEFLRGMYWFAGQLVDKERVTVRDLRVAIEEEWGDEDHWRDAIKELKLIEKQEKLAEIEQLEV